MQQFLLSVEIPKSGYTQEWIDFENEANTILKTATSCMSQQICLQRNVWLLPSENLLPALIRIAEMAKNNHLSYSVFLIDNATDISAKKVHTAQTPTIRGL